MRRISKCGRSIACRLVLVTLATAAGAGLVSSAARAANLPYDGSDPIATGCTSGATTPRAAGVADSRGHYLGTIQLRWSGRCGTNWATAVANGGTAYMDPVVVRQSDGKWCGATASGCYSNPYFNSSQVYTNQLYGAGVCVYAEGWIWSPWDGQWHFAQTAPAC